MYIQEKIEMVIAKDKKNIDSWDKTKSKKRIDMREKCLILASKFTIQLKVT